MLNDYLDKEAEMYNRIGQVQQKLPKSLNRLNKDLRIFGLEIFEKEDTIFIQTHEEILNFAYKINLGTQVQSVQEEQDCTKNVPVLYPKENTKNIQIPYINNNNNSNVLNVPDVPIKNKSEDKQEMDFSELNEVIKDE